jgi:hypothetical protein
MPRYDLGLYENGIREVINCGVSDREIFQTWLSCSKDDPNELANLAGDNPQKLKEMQRNLRGLLLNINAPAEQLERLGLGNI